MFHSARWGFYRNFAMRLGRGYARVSGSIETAHSCPYIELASHRSKLHGSPVAAKPNMRERRCYLRDVLQPELTSGEDCEFAKLPQAPQLQCELVFVGAGLDLQEQK